MQTSNPLFEELARLMSGAMGTMAGMREEAEAQMRQQFERVFQRMDVVTRDEFEAVQEMAAAARAEQEALAERVAALEAKLAELSAPAADDKKTAAAGRAKSGNGRRTRARRSGAGDAGGGATD